MRRFILVIICILFPFVCLADCSNINKGIAVFWMRQWQEDDNMRCDNAVIDDDFYFACSIMNVSPIEYHICNQLSPDPNTTLDDYVTSFTACKNVHIATHGSQTAFDAIYFIDAESRDTAYTDYIASGWDTLEIGRSIIPTYSIAFMAQGIHDELKPKLNEECILAAHYCESLIDLDVWGNFTSAYSGPTIFGYNNCPDSGDCENINAIVGSLGCLYYLWFGVRPVTEDALTFTSGIELKGNKENMWNCNRGCWDWVGYFELEGYADGEVYYSVINEDSQSVYHIRGYTHSSAEPDTLLTVPGLGTDGKWRLRTYSWPVQENHEFGDVVHVDELGIPTVSEEFAFSEANAPPDTLESFLLNPDLDTSTLYLPLPSFPGAPSSVSEVDLGLNREQDCTDCADVVVYSSDVGMIVSVVQHIDQYPSPNNDDLVVRGFWGPPDFASIQQAMATVHQANIDYMMWVEECPHYYPVYPGPIGVLVGNDERVNYNLWEDDPIENPCRLEHCASYNDAGNTNYDPDWIQDCPIMVIDALSLESLQAKLQTAEEWNSGQFVNPAGRTLIIADDHLQDEIGPVVSENMAKVNAAYQGGGTPTTYLRHSDFGEYDDRLTIGINAINSGVEQIWLQGYATTDHNWTVFIPRNESGMDQLTTKQRVLVFAPTCETLGFRHTYPDNIMHRLFASNDPEKTVVIGTVGQTNGDYGMRHADALEVLLYEIETATHNESLVNVIWRVNRNLQTQFSNNINYARGLTLFANGFIYSPPDGGINTADAPSSDIFGGAAELWTNPASVGTDIRFTLNQVSKVDLAVYDIAGRKVSTINKATYGPGAHRETWYHSAQRVSSGIYFVRLSIQENGQSRTLTSKTVVVK